MKTLLIPIDFSATSDNAVALAAEWSKQYGYERIILLKSFYDSVFESVTLSAGYANMNEDYLNRDRTTETERLRQSCKSLAAALPHVKVMTAFSELPLLRAVIELVQNEKPELIVLGSDNYRHSSESFVSGHVISIAKISPTRVLIVPANYTYRPVKEALVPCDFNALDTVDKVNSIRANPQWHNVRLHVLNIDAKEEYRHADEKFKERENRLHGYLKNFEHQVYYRNDRNAIDGIKNFVNEHDVQLIIALPGKRSFLYNLTHSNISEAIYRNARLPVLILK